ncbi:MAG: phage holin family protein [bacterium]
MTLLLRWLLNSAFLLLLSQILPGFILETPYAAIIAAAFIGVLNAIARPILIILTLPINFLTLGLFTFFINALIILFVATFVKGFYVENVSVAILAAILIWLFSWGTNMIMKDDKNVKSFWHVRGFNNKKHE